MDLDAARFLAGATGARLLAAARETRELTPTGRLKVLGALGTPEEVRSVLQQDDLRRRAAPRCPEADRLLFTPHALEQATAWPVARERAGRWPEPLDVPLADLGAGIGLDALAAAAAGRPVTAFERDPARALLLRFNVEACGLGDLVAVRGDDFLGVRPGGRLAFLDPDRRPGGGRTREPEAFEPPSGSWHGLLDRYRTGMVKLPPALECGALEGTPFEVVSLAGRARERRHFPGAWPDLAPRRALRLPDGTSIEGPGIRWPEARAVAEGDWLLDPDASVTLAGLVGDLAARHGLRPLHPRIAYLVGTEPVGSAPGTWMRVAALLPTKPKPLNAWLHAHDVGRLTLRKRGVADKVETWRKRLRPRGAAAGTLVFTRDLRDRWVALGCVED